MNKGPAYLHLLRRHLRDVELQPGKVHHVEVRHADECPFWDGHPCDCEPEVLSRTRRPKR